MKTRLLLAVAGLAIGFALPTFAQEQKPVDSEVRQQIEAVIMKFNEAYNKHDAAALVALYTQDAIEVWPWEEKGGAAFGCQAIEQRWAAELASDPPSGGFKVVQIYAVGNDVCAIEEWNPSTSWRRGHRVTIYVRDADTWKIRIIYVT
jgi:ketosteroid isomerase-like protein